MICIHIGIGTHIGKVYTPLVTTTITAAIITILDCIIHTITVTMVIITTRITTTAPHAPMIAISDTKNRMTLVTVDTKNLMIVTPMATNIAIPGIKLKYLPRIVESRRRIKAEV